MTAVEYLSQARYLDARVRSKLCQVEDYQSLVQSITAAYGTEAVSRSRNVSSLTDTVNRIVEAENELDGEISELLRARAEISKLIRSVHNDQYRLVLEMRYLCGKTFEDIAEEMRCTPRWVCEVHTRAIVLVERIRKRESVDDLTEN